MYGLISAGRQVVALHSGAAGPQLSTTDAQLLVNFLASNDALRCGVQGSQGAAWHRVLEIQGAALRLCMPLSAPHLAPALALAPTSAPRLPTSPAASASHLSRCACRATMPLPLCMRMWAAWTRPAACLSRCSPAPRTRSTAWRVRADVRAASRGFQCDWPPAGHGAHARAAACITAHQGATWCAAVGGAHPVVARDHPLHDAPTARVLGPCPYPPQPSARRSRRRSTRRACCGG